MTKQDDDTLLLARLKLAENKGWNAALSEIEWAISFMLHSNPQSDLERQYNRGTLDLAQYMGTLRKPKT